MLAQPFLLSQRQKGETKLSARTYMPLSCINFTAKRAVKAPGQERDRLDVTILSVQETIPTAVAFGPAYP
jgi:hypothetical protein